ncbi:MAG: Crp/Fnr family transcriptional regulator [Ruminococcaceae bacterium]|nr:Crp/Fnr family transcriptional regulator [Oscillospiraceae bacterium]
MPDHTLYQLFAETFPFWEGLTDGDKEALVRSSYPVDFKKGTHIHDGNECTGVILVRSGNLRLYLLSSEGKEVTLYRLYGGDVCVLSASCVLDAITFDVSVDAEEDSACVVVGSCVLEELSRRIPQVKLFIMEIALSRFSDVMWVMQQILFMSMDKRLAIFLLDESAKTGSDTVKLTHEQIAKYMGSAREVVTRMLKYFSAEGMISATRGEGIKLLDKKRLRALAFQQL